MWTSQIMGVKGYSLCSFQKPNVLFLYISVTTCLIPTLKGYPPLDLGVQAPSSSAKGGPHAVEKLTISSFVQLMIMCTSASILNPDPRAPGMNQFEYMKTHPEFLASFQSAFKDFTPQFATAMSSKYRGFANVQTLVDVGGGSGMILSYVVHKYPHIRCTNQTSWPNILAFGQAND